MAQENKSNQEQEMEQNLHRLRGGRVWWGVLIGLGVVAWLFIKDFDPEAFNEHVHWTWRAWIWIPVALLLMIGRDVGYMWRIRVLSERDLSWWQVFRIVMLWEFTSAVTPSAIGGTSVAIIYVHKEGMNVGRSSAVVLATSFLDEIYFLIMFPLLVWIVGWESLFTITGAGAPLRHTLIWLAVGGYSIKTLYVLLLGYGFFINPRGLKWLLLRVFKLRFLRRWRHGAYTVGNELVTCAREFKHKGFKYWGEAVLSTFLSWSCRYWVANVLLLAFFSVKSHLLIFARQLVLWIVMLLSPTPGGSGFSEYFFAHYLGEFIPVDAVSVGAIVVVLALLWRLVTYYPYLIVGSFILPPWMNRHFGKTKASKKAQSSTVVSSSSEEA